MSNQVIWTYLSCNVVTDFYLLSIPVPMLWQSSLKPAKKVGLIILFSGGLFVIICAILRCVLIVTVSSPGACVHVCVSHRAVMSADMVSARVRIPSTVPS